MPRLPANYLLKQTSVPPDTPYVIAVIRARERSLLGTDEYTRMIEAPTLDEALGVLVETPYGQWLEPQKLTVGRVLAALEERLVTTQHWLVEVVDKPSVVAWLQVRYDALNIVTALLAYHDGEVAVPALSRLGAISPNELFSTIWHDTGWEDVPKYWQAPLKSGRQVMPDSNGPAWKTNLVSAVEQQAAVCLEKLAVTSLMKRLPHVPVVRGSIYEEQAWVQQVLRRLKPARWEPVGYDPILAFWFDLRFEVESIRLILAGKKQGMAASAMHSLVRAYAQA